MATNTSPANAPDDVVSFPGPYTDTHRLSCPSLTLQSPLTDLAARSHVLHEQTARQRRCRYMSNMPGGKHRARAPVLPMQVQRQHQIRTPRMPHGMAVAFAKEVLRAVQDFIPLYQTLPPWHADPDTHLCLYTSRCRAHTQALHDMVSGRPGSFCVAGPTALVHARRLAQFVLGRRRRLDS
jgi:hypothetical protein